MDSYVKFIMVYVTRDFNSSYDEETMTFNFSSLDNIFRNPIKSDYI
jgi:hypothetical protein